jgi:hypothetical protein
MSGDVFGNGMQLAALAGAAGWAPGNLAPEQRRDGRQIVDM